MRLLLAVDIHSTNPGRLVNEAVLWAQRTGATLDLAHVGRGDWSVGTAAAPEVKALLAREMARAQEGEQARLESLRESIPEEHRGTATVLRGHPIEALVQASAKHAALLVGTHGRTGLKRFWLGSVSEQLVRRALCPVLTLRLYLDE